MYKAVVNKFNRGEIDDYALAREDVDKVNNSCNLMTNFMPMRLGPMIYRPGSQYLGAPAGQSYFVPFIYSNDDTALLEFSNNLMRVWVNDALVTRTAVTSTITNGGFPFDITGWTNASETGSTATWIIGSGTGVANLRGTNATSAILYQTITTEVGVEHALRVIIEEGKLELRIGTTGANSYDIYKGDLYPGTHSLAFTPSANITITLRNLTNVRTLIDSVDFESAGVMTLPTSITSANLPLTRVAQSADVVFMANNGQYRIERRGVKSWSIVDYYLLDGPFNSINNSSVKLSQVSNLGGSMLASESFFDSGNIGGLFKISSDGQGVQNQYASSENTGTKSIKVTGIGTSRNINITIVGTWAGTITLQRASTKDGPWEDVPLESYTVNTTKTYLDGLDNAIHYYRLWFRAGNYTSGTAHMVLTTATGTILGIGLITNVASPTGATIFATKDHEFGLTGSITYTLDWYEGAWSTKNGHPTSVAFYEGRLFWAGKNRLWGSVSDIYNSFDDEVVGDSAPISRTIGFGAVDDIHWLAKGNRLIMGTASDEIAVRSSSFDEPLTQLNCNLKKGTTQGVANIAPVEIDDRIYYVHRSGIKLYELSYNSDNDGQKATDLTLLNQSICSAGITRLAVSRQPETRIYLVLGDGTARVLLMDETETVLSWSRIEMDGTIEDVVVLPGAGEDVVYLIVNRTSGRCFERMSKFSEVEGGTISKHFDSFVQYSSPGTTLTGLTHLEGKTVGVWADGQDRGTYVVGSGQITVASAWTDVIVGLPYTADYISNKVGNFVNESVLNSRKQIMNTGVILKNYWPGSLSIGPSIARLSALPGIENGTDVDSTTTISDYDELPFEYDDDTQTDPRIYIRATGPCTLLALTYEVKYDARTKATPS